MNINYIILHHTATPGKGDGELEWNTIMKLCQQRRGEDYLCDYHFGIGPTGRLFTGQITTNPCWHCGIDAINLASLAVACIGNFEQSPMPDLQRTQLILLLQKLKFNYPGAKINLHKDIVPTLCPGKYFPSEEVQARINSTNRFSDLTPDNIFYPAIQEIVQKGIMVGDREGTFRPKEMVSREELAQVITNLLKKL